MTEKLLVLYICINCNYNDFSFCKYQCYHILLLVLCYNVVMASPQFQISFGKIFELLTQKQLNCQKIWKWYFFTKIVLNYCEKKNLVIEITRTIHSKSESSELFLVTECFFNLFPKVLRSNELQQLEFKFEKNIWI